MEGVREHFSVPSSPVYCMIISECLRWLSCNKFSNLRLACILGCSPARRHWSVRLRKFRIKLIAESAETDTRF